MGYEALTGRRPFGPDDNIGALACAILQDDAPPLHLVQPSVDPRLAAVIERARSRGPTLRFASADEMRAAINGRIQLVVPAGGNAMPPRQLTKMLDAPPVPPTYIPPIQAPAYAPISPQARKKRRRVVQHAAIFAALTIAALALAVDSPSTQSGTDPVSTSTSVAPVSSPMPPPPPPPTAAPVVEQPNNHGQAVGGNGKKGGHGNGKGPKK